MVMVHVMVMGTNREFAQHVGIRNRTCTTCCISVLFKQMTFFVALCLDAISGLVLRAALVIVAVAVAVFVAALVPVAVPVAVAVPVPVAVLVLESGAS